MRRTMTKISLAFLALIALPAALHAQPGHGPISGGPANASTATALAANGANCSAGSFPLGVDASGAAESCTAAVLGSTGATDNSLLRSDGVGGSALQNSLITVSDTGLTSINSTNTGTATLGAELLANSTFTTNLGSWTAGAGWAYEAGDSARHTAGNTATLAQNVTVESGSSYQVSFTISGRTAGTIAVALGAVSLNQGGAVTWSATNAGTGIVAAATGSVSFAITPTTDFDGKIDDVSLKLITAASSILTAQSSSANFLESRGSAALFNQFLGVGSGALNTTGSHSTTLGSQSLAKNTTGLYETGVGYRSLYANLTGNYLTGLGYFALGSNVSGSNNSATGFSALSANTIGGNGTAMGANSLLFNSSGSNNSGLGYGSLFYNSTGASNLGAGFMAGAYIADGTTANSTSGTSTFLGANTKASANGVANETVIGYNAIGSGSNTVALGNTSVLGVTTTAGLYATRGAAPTIASATTIAPTKGITFVSGTTTIENITAPNPISLGGGQITIIPTGLFVTGVTGNIALATTAVVSKALIMTYDATTTKWYPSY